jgi:hypothetical protein
MRRRRNHEWAEGRVGGIANDMYNNDVGQGVVYAYEAYEAKWRVAVFRAPVCLMIFWADSLPTSLLYISILLQTRRHRDELGKKHDNGCGHQLSKTPANASYTDKVVGRACSTEQGE